MTEKVVSGNRKFCRSICEAYDYIVQTMSLPVEDPDKCVELIKYVEFVSNDESYRLKVNYFFENILKKLFKLI